MSDFGAFDRFCLILFAVIFYMAIRLLQDVREDIREIANYIESRE